MNQMRKMKSDNTNNVLTYLPHHKSLSKLNDEKSYYSGNIPNKSTLHSEMAPYGNITNRDCYKSHSSIELNRENKRPVSLANISSNCYLNSGLQALSSCKLFVNGLKQLQSEHSELEKLRVFHILIQVLFYGQTRSLELPSNPIFQNWNKTGQQDSFELLTFIINEVYDEIKKKIKKNNSSDTWLEIHLPLRIICEHKISCCLKDNISRHQQCDLALHIPFSRPNDQATNSFELEYLLDQNFTPEVIEDYKCSVPNCNGSEAKKTMRLCQPLPATICIHLQRLFWENRKMRKIENFVKFSEEIIIKKSYCVGVSVDQKYVLRSVIVHYGDASFGHYICYKLFNYCWFRTDDSSIRETDLETVLRCQAYILFFEKDENIQTKDLIKTSTSRIKDLNTITLNKTVSATSDRSYNLIESDKSIKKVVSTNMTPVYDKNSDILCCTKAVISALSFCQNFVNKLIQYLYETKSFKVQLIECIIKNSVPLSANIPGITDCLKTNIFQTFVNIMNVIYEDDRDMDFQDQSKIKCPLRISLKVHEECNCHPMCTKEQSQYAFELNKSQYQTLQCAFNEIFERKSLNNDVSNTHIYSCSKYKFIRLNEPLPETICFHILYDFNIYIPSFNKVVLQKSFLSNEKLYLSPIRSISISKNYNYFQPVEYVFVLKSIVKYESKRYTCYKFIDGKLFEADSLKVELSNYMSLHENDILFFEKELQKSSNLSITQADFLLPKSGAEQIILNKLEKFLIPAHSKLQSEFYVSKEWGNSSYLKIIFYALSNCSKLIEDVYRQVIECEKNFNLILPLMFCILKNFDKYSVTNAAEWIAERLIDKCQKNLFQFALKLFEKLDREWSSLQLQNPFKVKKILKIQCGFCNKEEEIYENGFAIHFPVDTSDDIDIQYSIDKIFKKQSLEGFQCEKKCSSNEDRIITKLCRPYPKIIIIHIGNVVLNGKINESFSNKVSFQDSIFIGSEHLEDGNGKSLNYNLKSIISYQSYQYMCYVKRNDRWFQVSENRLRESCIAPCPNIMFYEFLEN